MRTETTDLTQYGVSEEDAATLIEWIDESDFAVERDREWLQRALAGDPEAIAEAAEFAAHIRSL